MNLFPVKSISDSLELAAAPGEQWEEMRDKPAQIEVPACQVCGRQDDSLRLVVYPFVFSLIVVTFRRSFHGLWCGHHRTLRAWLAGLITAGFGWLGIPYGLFYAPSALFRLAKGGEVPAEANARLLRSLAQYKASQGDLDGARRCWETSLRFCDDPQARAQLSSLYRRVPSSGQVGQGLPAAHILFPLLALVTIAILGGVVGVLDYLFSTVFSLLAGESSSLVIAFISWVPLISLSFTCVLMGRDLVEWVLVRLRLQQSIAGAAFAGAAALLGVYGIAQGNALGHLADMVLSGYGFSSPAHLLSSTGAVLLRGGAWDVWDALQGGQTWGLIYAVLLVVMFGFSLFANLNTALQTAGWQKRLEPLMPAYPDPGRTQHNGLFLVSVGAVGVLLLGALLLPQQGIVDYFDAINRYQRSVQFWEDGDLDSAMVEVEAALALDPAMVSWRTELGWLHYYRGDYQAAQAVFNQVLADYPGDSMAYHGLGLTYLELGDTLAAIETLQQVLAAQPDFTPALVSLGWVYLDQEDYADAEQAFTHALDLDPLRFDAQQGLGMVFLAQAQYERAIFIFQQSVEQHPDSFDALYSLGKAYLATEHPLDAIHAFEDAVRLAPEVGEIYLEMGIAYYQNDDLDQAVTALEQAADRMPGSADPFIWLGQIFLEQHDPVKAVGLLEQALEIDPQNPYIRFIMGIAYWQQGISAAARDNFIAASNLFPQWGAPQALLADVFNQTGQIENMETAIQNALAVSTGDDLTHYFLAGVFFDLRDFAAAQEQIEEALAIAPDDIPSLVFLGNIHSAQGHYEQLLAMGERILALDSQESRAYVLRADAYIEQEDLLTAEAELEIALQLDSEDESALRSMAFTLLQQGRLVEAREMNQAALAIAPYYASAYTTQALIDYAEGNIPAALESAQRAIELRPARDLPHYVLGLCYRDLGKGEEAILELETFLDLYWDRAYVRDYRVQAETYLAEMADSPGLPGD